MFWLARAPCGLHTPKPPRSAPRGDAGAGRQWGGAEVWIDLGPPIGKNSACGGLKTWISPRRRPLAPSWRLPPRRHRSWSTPAGRAAAVGAVAEGCGGGRREGFGNYMLSNLLVIRCYRYPEYTRCKCKSRCSAQCGRRAVHLHLDAVTSSSIFLHLASKCRVRRCILKRMLRSVVHLGSPSGSKSVVHLLDPL